MMKSIGWDTSFHLNGKFPLLDNSIFPSLTAAKSFVSDPTSSAIAGTIIGVDDPSNSNETGLYEIFNNSGELALRKLVSEETLSSYQTKIDSLVTDLSDNYSSELAELAGQLADLLEALRDEMFSPDNDTTPITRTMMLLVGADSTNYRFSTKESGKNDTDGIVFNSSDKSLTFLSGTLYHFSITDSLGKPRTWSISEDSYIELEGVETLLGKYMRLSDHVGKGKSLWVYLKVPKTGSEGVWFLSPTKYACILDETLSPGEGLILGSSEHYYLLYGYCGIIPAGSPFFEPIYGNTWIKGSTIYTGKVQTMDGYSKLDLDNNTLKLGNDFYYADGLVVVGNPDTGAFVFHKHGNSKTALHVGTMTKDSNGNESWNGMTFADGELTIGKYDERLHEMQTQLDKEVSTWYGEGIPLPYKENNESNTVDSVAPELVASYNETLTTDENGVKMFNLSPDPEPLPRHINDIYINSITGVGYRLVVNNWGREDQLVYWLQLSLWDLLNILNLLNGVNTEVGNIKKALDITEDGLTTIGDKFILTMMLRIGADSTNYTLTKTSTSGNRMLNLYWTRDVNDSGSKYTALRAKESELLKHECYYRTVDGTKKYIWELSNTIGGEQDLVTIWDDVEYDLPIYLYIRCSTVSNKAIWHSSTYPQPLLKELNDKITYYFFPFATITDPAKKTLVEVRGNTKIIGDRIITGKLESNTGNSFFDLDNGLFALGVDLSDPGDLSKAAFSFDGSKVHIGGAGYTWVEKNNIEKFILGISSIPDNKYIGQVQGLTKLLLNTGSGGEFLIKYSLGVMTSDPDLLISESTFGMEGNSPYCICIGEPDVNSTTNKLTNELYDFSKDSDGLYVCLFSTLNALDIYIIRGEISKNGELYNFTTNDPDGDLYFYIYDILLNLWGPNTEDKGLRASLLMGSTDISGGLVLTNCLGVRDSSGDITAGICGINDNTNTVAFWAGGSMEEKETAPVRLTFSGSLSQLGPLKIESSDTISAYGSDPSKGFIISTSGKDAYISVVDGQSTLKLYATDIDTSGSPQDTVNTWSSGTIYSNTIKSSGNNDVALSLVKGTILLNKASNPSSGTVSHTITTSAVGGNITVTFTGTVNNSSSRFGLTAYIDLFVGGVLRTTLCSIDKPLINNWHDQGDGYIKTLESNSKAFQVTFTVPTKTLNNAITINDFNKSYEIKLRIKHFSRWWAVSSKTFYVNNWTKDNTYKTDWTINIASLSPAGIKVTYKADYLGGTSSGVNRGIISTLGFLFSDSAGTNTLAASVKGKNLVVVFGNLPADSAATPLGINSSGRLVRITSSSS